MASNLTRRGALPSIPSNTTVRRQAQDRGPRTTYLAFRLAENVYAAPLSLIREILVRVPLTPVPRAHPSIMGIISNRGQLITVFDLRRRLRLTEGPETNKGRILTTNPTGVELIGLYVDEVCRRINWPTRRSTCRLSRSVRTRRVTSPELLGRTWRKVPARDVRANAWPVCRRKPRRSSCSTSKQFFRHEKSVFLNCIEALHAQLWHHQS